MDLKLLLYFKVFAKHLNFSKAAKELGITQPTLSQQIKKFEQNLGVTLILRSSSGNSLTEAGKLLLKRSETIDSLLETTLVELNEFSNSERITLTVGVFPGELSDLIVNICIAFHQKYPTVQMRVLNIDDIEKAFSDGIIDVGISYSNISQKGRAVSEKLLMEKFWVISDQSFSLPKTIRGEELVKFPLILFTDTFTCRNLIDREAEKKQINIVPTVEVTNINVVEKLVKNKMGVSIVSDTFLKLSNENYSRTTITNFNLKREVFITKSNKPNSHVLDFIDSIHSEIEKLN
jgi:LysR family transcriptional regulator, cyn operon transcriptional activator